MVSGVRTIDRELKRARRGPRLFRTLSIETEIRVVQNENANTVVGGRWEADGGAGVAAWWPGSEFVDWCGVSIFQQGYPEGTLQCRNLHNIPMKGPEFFSYSGTRMETGVLFSQHTISIVIESDWNPPP